MKSGLIWTIVIFLAICIFFVARSMLKTGRPLRAFIVSAIQGLTVLFAINVISAATHVTLSVNAVTMTVSGIMGIPGVIMLLILQVLF